MIKTKQIFQPVDKLDGTRILITQGPPGKLNRFHFDEHIEELAPSLSLLSAYKGWKGEPITWEEYEERFLEEMKSSKSREWIEELAKRSLDGEVITLLCYEREQNPHCHRHIVKRLILEVENKLSKS